jgi:predicted nuclease with TOPRIM domain
MSMRAQLENRLDELRKEYERGLNELRELEGRQNTLRQTMLRISGAIQVIEEELKRTEPAAESGPAFDETTEAPALSGTD